MASPGSGTSSPAPSMRSRRRSCARRLERYCCTTVTYLPLLFVYGLTTWAVWVQANVGWAPKQYGHTGSTTSLIGIALYLLLNWCYSVAVFTDPGSPLTQLTSAYSVLPTSDPRDDPELNIHAPPMTPGPAHSSLTVKSNGELRYCKKCHTQKPDRAHHCSSCRRCVLKMDHHCPWLATCVGFRNYKPFLLFLIYTCFFCGLCFFVSGSWVVSEIFGDPNLMDQLMPVNCVLLAVLSGILGLVLSGFTGWHIYLACRNQTTIESLESTRYLSPVKKAMQEQRQKHQNQAGQDADSAGQSLTSQLLDIHANALPGITRPEEGVVTVQQQSTPLPPSTNSSPAKVALLRNLTSNPYHPANEAQRERERYAAYLDELDSSKLPHAFDHGWRSNLRHLFGERLLLAWLPLCNTTGDGWNWQPSDKWLSASAHMARQRAERDLQHPSSRDEIEMSSTSVSTLDDDDGASRDRRLAAVGGASPSPATPPPMQNWNDVPDELLRARGGRTMPVARSRGVAVEPASQDKRD